jgi:hypothetical protein
MPSQISRKSKVGQQDKEGAGLFPSLVARFESVSGPFCVCGR